MKYVVFCSLSSAMRPANRKKTAPAAAAAQPGMPV
jgi:hypothetical protein